MHERIMNAVAAEQTPARVFRLPGWARVAWPFAAAAMVAWVVWLAVMPREARRAAPDAPGIEVVHHGSHKVPIPADETAHTELAGRPSAPPTKTQTPDDSLVVQYERQETTTNAGQPPIEVTFPRSTELAQEIRKIDQARESMPSWHLFMANTPDQQPTPAADPEEFGPPPM